MTCCPAASLIWLAASRIEYGRLRPGWTVRKSRSIRSASVAGAAESSVTGGPDPGWRGEAGHRAAFLPLNDGGDHPSRAHAGAAGRVPAVSDWVHRLGGFLAGARGYRGDCVADCGRAGGADMQVALDCADG